MKIIEKPKWMLLNQSFPIVYELLYVRADRLEQTIA
jgi:hypothetical protein